MEMKYYVTETQNAQSKSEGREIEAKELSSAKRAATNGQFYNGTVLTIYESGKMVAERANGKWINA